MRLLNSTIRMLPGAVLLLSICACEATLDAPTDLPYREQLVVSGVLEPGNTIDSIQFLRTLPIGDEYSLDRAAVSDVDATIRFRGTEYPLHYLDSGFYSTDSLIAMPGERYTLSARWRGTEVHGSTRVPYPLDSASVTLGLFPVTSPRNGDTGYYRLTATFTPRPEQVYGLGYVLVNGANVGQSEGSLITKDAIVRVSDTAANGRMTLLSRGDSPLTGPPPYMGFVRFYTFDEPYFRFYTTFGDDEAGDRVFSASQEKVQWNVRGDGIGIFIGRAITVVQL